LSACQPHASVNMLVNPATSIDLFHTASGVAFADLTIDGHRETWPVRSTRLRARLRRQYYEATGDAPSAEVVTLQALSRSCRFDLVDQSIVRWSEWIDEPDAFRFSVVPQDFPKQMAIAPGPLCCGSTHPRPLPKPR
jgi:hypothetical protein